VKGLDSRLGRHPALVLLEKGSSIKVDDLKPSARIGSQSKGQLPPKICRGVELVLVLFDFNQLARLDVAHLRQAEGLRYTRLN
jgi:hypothetical protein